MDIRRATPDDAEALAKVHIDSWRSAYRGLVPDSHLAELDYERSARRFRQPGAGLDEETYVAEQDGEVLGFVTLGPCRDTDVDGDTTGEIWGVYLAPEHWRKGIGTRLCRHAEHVLRSRGCATVTLWVFDANASARRFYETMGFEPDGASKMLNPGTPLKAVRYHKAWGDPGAPGAPD